MKVRFGFAWSGSLRWSGRRGSACLVRAGALVWEKEVEKVRVRLRLVRFASLVRSARERLSGSRGSAGWEKGLKVRFGFAWSVRLRRPQCGCCAATLPWNISFCRNPPFGRISAFRLRPAQVVAGIQRAVVRWKREAQSGGAGASPALRSTLQKWLGCFGYVCAILCLCGEVVADVISYVGVDYGGVVGDLVCDASGV